MCLDDRLRQLSGSKQIDPPARPLGQKSIQGRHVRFSLRFSHILNTTNTHNNPP
jgi:hypothetical protein